MTNSDTPQNPQSALKEMTEKLDHRKRDTNGYTTHLPEIQRILSELTPNHPAVVLERLTPSAPEDISVEIRIGFTIGRSEL